MTKWEYLRLYVKYISYLDKDTGKVESIYSNGVIVFDDRKKPIEIHDYLNRLGNDRWELINVNNLSEVEIYHFKRPLEE
ncbi:MAG: hypothetical protein ACYC6R_09730 [Anaerolineales bacterium]